MSGETTTAAPPNKAAAKEKTTKIPMPEVGMPLHWYQEGDSGSVPFSAFVTAVGGETITVNIMSPGTRNFDVRDGVMHISDPRCRRVETRDAGGWDYPPWLAKLLKLAEGFDQ